MNALDYIKSKSNEDLQSKLVRKLADTRAAKLVKDFDEDTFSSFVAFGSELNHNSFSNALLGRFAAFLSFSHVRKNQSIETEDILEIFTKARRYAVADKIQSDIRKEVFGY
jgi:hypothetical protein